jgi:hypothetical protein
MHYMWISSACIAANGQLTRRCQWVACHRSAVCCLRRAKTVAVDEAFQMFGVGNELMWPENGALRH